MSSAASDPSDPVTFVVTGQRQAVGTLRGAAPAEPAVGRKVKFSLRVGTVRSGGSTERAVAVPGQDVVALHIAGGPVLYLHPHNARDLMLAQSRGAATRSATALADGVVVPAQLGWPGQEPAGNTRAGGWVGRVLVTAFEIIGLDTTDPISAAADLAASAVVARVDGQVDAGVYGLSPEHLARLKGSGRKLAAVPAASEPMLVLLHGTFVDTFSTFGKLWSMFPDRVRALFAHYGGRVYALDHPTLGASPIDNALTLVQALPHGARLHLASHSRGGLVAEVLARVAGPRLGAADLAFFEGAAFSAQREALRQLARLVQAKGIRVERVVRVACPARGTLLASKRLDAYLSVLTWALQATGVALLPALLDFVAEVARRRADPSQLPGLQAMMPESPLVRWLNRGEPVDGELRVVAGDLQGDSIGSWLKTLLADAYYWTDNDVVVQTRSMYGGAPRSGGALFLLDRGGKVTHFNYFANERTVQALVAGLTEARPVGYGVIGPLSWAGQDSGGLRARRGADSAAAAVGPARPAVFVLPGILGSNLQVSGQRIWLSLRLVGGLARLRYRAGEPDDVTPDGPVGAVYDALIDHLAATHEVIPFAYDWRRPVEEEARRLAQAVQAAIEMRTASGQPVRLLAHSMGGVLARTMQLECPEVFQRLMAHPGARLLMLGTPNAGSWAPMQVLSGDDTFGNALAALGSPLANQQARQLMAEMPGFLQLQAGLLDASLGLDRSETWARLASQDLAAVQELNWWHRYAGEEQQAAYAWGVPPQPVLDSAVALRRRLELQRERDLPAFADKLCLVVGHAARTPTGFVLDERGLAYQDSVNSGDGRVPLASALLAGVKTWLLDSGHGELPSKAGAFDAYVELLEGGETVRLARLDSSAALRSAGSAPLQRSRPSRQPAQARPAGSESAVFTTPTAEPDAEAGRSADGAPGATAALHITVLNGNLTFVGQPLLLGHYRAGALSGTEAVVDRLIGGSMTVALGAGLYPEALGTQQVFANGQRDPLNPWRPPNPQAAIVVGLGEEGQLREAGIVASVRQGTLAWAQRAAEDPAQGGPVIELAATLLGSGGMGISAAGAAAAVARGVHDANQRLQAGGWPVVGRLTLVELYLDRATEAWQGLRLLAAASPQSFSLQPAIEFGTGPLRRRLDGGYRGADYDLISITAGAAADSLSFAVDTRRARTEVRAQVTQGRLVREMVGRAAQDQSDDPQIGRTLFQLLVPVELEPFLAGTERVVLELDSATAPIPWELLDTGSSAQGGDARPWALRTQLLRRLRKASFRSQPRDANADDAVLVVGEPQTPAEYGPLPGARAEAEAVLAQLTGPGALDASRVRALLGGADASAVINALLERPYRIVHIAGHGEAPQGERRSGGVVLSGGHFLGPREIQSMRTVPEMVFVNCCHLASYQAGQTLSTPDPAAFAAGVADELISIGVRCVVAAGWAVEDDAAEAFAATFYRELLAGRSFMAAVAAARETAWAVNPAGKTWAAYQCYGDPDWTYRSSTGDAQGVTRALHTEYDAIASPPALALALEEMVTRQRWMGGAREAQRDRLLHLEARFGGTWGDIGAVAEAFGLAWLELGDLPRAMAWTERALQCNDGSASIKAQEQLLNLRVRVAWAAARTAHEAASAPLATPDAEQLKALQARAADALAQGRQDIEAAVQELRHLSQRHRTLERLALLGSAHKRQAQLEQLAGQPKQVGQALSLSLQAYREAETLAAQTRHPDLFYPALNRMAIERVIEQAQGGRSRWDRSAADAARASLTRRIQESPDFWSHVGLVELAMLEATAQGSLERQQQALEAGYAEIHARVPAPWLWASVADQALFTLQPVLAAGSAAECRAAEALLAQLGGFAWRGAAERQRWERAVTAAHAAVLKTTTRAAPRGRAPDSPPSAGPDPFDAVVWFGKAELSVAAAVSAALAARGLRVWRRPLGLASAELLPDLQRALSLARVAVVVLGKHVSAQGEGTLEEWSLLQAAAWRDARPTLLATVAPPRVQLPGFLQDSTRLDSAAVLSGPAAVQQLLAQLPNGQESEA